MKIIILKNGEVYTPEYIGIKDILIGGDKILAIYDDIKMPKGVYCEVIDCTGKKIIPGLIDGHVHIAGAGGEGGPSTRTPEMKLTYMIEAGVTTVIGCLGTDGITRTVESVLMKAKSLKQQGVSAWILTGSYQIPTPTILGDVSKDIAMIEEVIGVGEIALSDHRSSYPTVYELIRLAEHARVGGMIGGKAGIVNIHMGDAQDPFKLIRQAVEMSELKFTQFWPTHINRNDYIFEDSKEYGKYGYVDITASSYQYFPEYEVKPSKAIIELLKSGVPLKHITLTSDACGSLPDFDEQGNLRKLEMGYPRSIYNEIIDTITQENLPMEQAISVSTSNVAEILKLQSKGRIRVGNDADVVIINQDFEIDYYIAMGQIMMRSGKIIKKGNYE